MSQNKSLKFGFLFIILLLVLNLVLVFLFPSKPPKISELYLPSSPVDPQIRITFSKQMDKDSVENGGVIFKPEIDGEISWTGNTFVFTPKDNLEFSTDYKIQINTTNQDSTGEYLKSSVEKKFKTDDLSLLFIGEAKENEGRLLKYNLATKAVSKLSPEDYEIEKYNYDALNERVVVLAKQKTEKISQPYVLDITNGKFNKIDDLSLKNYKIHFIKWVPYENAVLISRTKILFLDNDGSIETFSQEDADTELILYDFDSEKSRQIKTGNALVYEFFPSPDGRKLSFINHQGAFTFKDINSGEESVIATAFINYFGFSPHGKYAIYLLASEFSTFTLKTDVVLQDQSGEKKIISLEETDSDVEHPTVSFDEKWLAFKYQPAFEEYRLALVNLDNPEVNLLTEKNQTIDDPAFAPDNKNLAFTQQDSFGLNQIKFYELAKKTFTGTELFGHDLTWQY